MVWIQENLEKYRQEICLESEGSIVWLPEWLHCYQFLNFFESYSQVPQSLLGIKGTNNNNNCFETVDLALNEGTMTWGNGHVW
jgi:hypothetical protein